MSRVHPTAVVGQAVVLAADVEIGPYAVIGYDFAAARNRYYSRPEIEREPVCTTLEAGVFLGPHVVVGTGALLGERTVVEPGCYVGEETHIGRDNFIRYGARVYSRVTIGERCVIGGFVCNETRIGNRVALFGATVHRFAGIRSAQREPAPVIEDDVLIGYGAVIIGAVTVRRGAVVPAGTILK